MYRAIVSASRCDCRVVGPRRTQGATICEQGVQQALAAASQPLKDKIKRSIAVITLGGFAEPSDFPPDVFVIPIEREHDSIPRFARGLNLLNPLNGFTLLRALLDLTRLKEHSLTEAYAPAPCPGGGICTADTCSGGRLDGKPCRWESDALSRNLAATESALEVLLREPITIEVSEPLGTGFPQRRDVTVRRLAWSAFGGYGLLLVGEGTQRSRCGRRLFGVLLRPWPCRRGLQRDRLSNP